MTKEVQETFRDSPSSHLVALPSINKEDYRVGRHNFELSEHALFDFCLVLGIQASKLVHFSTEVTTSRSRP